MKKVFYPAILILFCLLSCKQAKNENKKVEIPLKNDEIGATPKTYAEISIKEGGAWQGREYIGGAFKNVTDVQVPKEHTDHSWYIRYEGPGWESNKVGYRLYLDWRNAIDIFGKVTEDLVLQKVGQDNFDSYHEMNDWGMDILKAGKSLGIGSYGRYVNGAVLHFQEVDSTYAEVNNSADQSSVSIAYSGWKAGNEKIDLAVNLAIKPDSRITQATLKPSKAMEGLCTGMVKFDGIPLTKKEGALKNWAYIATYGEQTLVPDKLGMAIFYKIGQATLVEGEFDHVITFAPGLEPIQYYFLGAWEKEKNGITNQADFYAYLDANLQSLESNNNL